MINHSRLEAGIIAAMFFIAGMLCAVMIAGCRAQHAAEKPFVHEIEETSHGYVEVIPFKDQHTTCYVLRDNWNHSGEGISCVADVNWR